MIIKSRYTITSLPDHVTQQSGYDTGVDSGRALVLGHLWPRPFQASEQRIVHREPVDIPFLIHFGQFSGYCPVFQQLPETLQSILRK